MADSVCPLAGPILGRSSLQCWGWERSWSRPAVYSYRALGLKLRRSVLHWAYWAASPVDQLVNPPWHARLLLPPLQSSSSKRSAGTMRNRSSSTAHVRRMRLRNGDQLGMGAWLGPVWAHKDSNPNSSDLLLT
jgi:hypothetical protein